MGHEVFDSKKWSGYVTSKNITPQSTVDKVYLSKSIHEKLDPKDIVLRESRDSDNHPKSTAIIIGLDVTGSMGSLAVQIASTTLHTLLDEIYAKLPVTDPQIMVCAIGDAFTDEAPFQATQFESDVTIIEQLQNIFFENRGGGNNGESYMLPWYFAARHTGIDCKELHGRKGFIFTIGDEPIHKVLTRDQIKTIFGDDVEADLSSEQLLSEVSRNYEVFHLLVKDYIGHNSKQSWGALLGERAMEVSDYTKITEIVISTLQLLAGTDKQHIIQQWDGTTGMVVSKAISGLTNTTNKGGLVIM